jgi:hypothetical protein
LQSIASWLKDGLSAARIAIRLSALRGSPASRNAVISIVHRNADLRRRPRGNRQLVMPAPGNQMLACDPTALAADHRGGVTDRQDLRRAPTFSVELPSRSARLERNQHGKHPMNSWQINTLEACCLLAVPLSLILTVLAAGLILG